MMITKTYSKVSCSEIELESYPNISVVIPAYNDAKTLQLTLRSILNQEYDGKLEIILVDDCSTDETPDIVRKYDNIKYIRHNINMGLARSVNDGVEEATYDYVCIIHADIVIPDKKWFKKMIPHLVLNDDVAAVTAPSIVPENVWRKWGFWDKALHAWEIIWSEKIIKEMDKKCVEVEYTPIKNDIFKKNLFLEVGGLDWKTYRVACEDVDLCKKLQKRGYKILSLPYPTYHIHSVHATGLSKILFNKNPQISEGQGVLFRKYRFRAFKIDNQIFKTLAVITLFAPNIIKLLGIIYILSIIFINTITAFRVTRNLLVLIAVPPVKFIDYFLDIFYFWKGFITGKQRK
ncbi:glycosyltransferase [Archaeoglobus sp.]